MSPQSLDRKEQRRKSLDRKKRDRRRNPIARDLRSSKYRMRVIEDSTKEKKGAKNWLSNIDKEIDND